MESIIEAGMMDDDFKYPEENERRVTESIAIIKQDISNLFALMNGKAFDTWEADSIKINGVSKKLRKKQKQIKKITIDA